MGIINQFKGGKNLLKYILLFAVALLFAACSSNIERMNYNMMVNSNIGDYFSKYEAETGTFPVEYLSNNIIEDIPGGSKYRVLIYQFDLKYNKNPYANSNNKFTYIAYAFENDKLMFFGLPEDYLKSENTKANEIGMRLADLIKSTKEN